MWVVQFSRELSHIMQNCMNPANAAFLGASNLNAPFVWMRMFINVNAWIRQHILEYMQMQICTNVENMYNAIGNAVSLKRMQCWEQDYLGKINHWQ